MTYTPILILLAEGIVRCILTILEIAAFIAVFFGIPGAYAYFAWFTQEYLQPAMDKESDISNAQEAFVYFFIMTIYSVVVMWGGFPYFSIRQELPIQARICLAGVFFALSIASTIFSLRLLFHMRLYWLQFEYAGLPYIAKHCQAIVIFITTLLGVNAGLVITFISYTMMYGYPTTVSSTLQQMKRETRELLSRIGLGAANSESDEEKI
jgi:hypothetical protein